VKREVNSYLSGTVGTVVCLKKYLEEVEGCDNYLR